MATLSLQKLWINVLPDGAAVSAYSIPARTRSYEAKIDNRVYAGGRVRAIAQEGVQSQIGFTLRLASWANVETLVGWLGRVVQVRDHRGTRYFGVFASVVPVEVPNESLLWDVQLEVKVVTFDEGV